MAIPSSLTIYQINDQFVQIDGLVSSLDAALFFNSATVTATLRDSNGDIVSGFDGLVLTYVAASEGVYRGNLPETFTATLGSGYVLQLHAVQGSTVANFFVKCKVKIRRT